MNATWRVFQLVAEERAEQRAEWGNGDQPHFFWLGLLMEELGELAEAITTRAMGEEPKSDIRAEAVQVAALAVALLEQFDREEVNLQDLARLGRKTAFVPAPDLTPQVATVREFGQEKGETP